MLYNFVLTQWNNESSGDWTGLVKDDLKRFNINLSITSLQSMSKATFKAMVKREAKRVAFEELLEKKNKHSKIKNLEYKELKMQNYLEEKALNLETKRNMYLYRTNMAQFKVNFKKSYSNLECDLCNSHQDDQKSSLRCKGIFNGEEENSTYEDIFKENIPIDIIETLKKVSSARKDLFK